MKLRPQDRVSMVQAERRAFEALSPTPNMLATPASIADAIWPDHNMKPQGAAGAASRVLKRLQKRGLARWVSRKNNWGWCRTAAFSDQLTREQSANSQSEKHP